MAFARFNYLPPRIPYALTFSAFLTNPPLFPLLTHHTLPRYPPTPLRVSLFPPRIFLASLCLYHSCCYKSRFIVSLLQTRPLCLPLLPVFLVLHSPLAPLPGLYLPRFGCNRSTPVSPFTRCAFVIFLTKSFFPLLLRPLL